MGEITISQFKSRIRLLVGLIIAAVLFLSGWSLLSERRILLQTAERQAAGYARALSQHAESSFAESDRVLKDLVAAVGSRGGCDKILPRDLYQMIRQQAQGSPQIGSIFLVDRNGQMFMNSLKFPSQPIDVSDREYFKDLLNNPTVDLYLSKPVLSRLVNRWRFNLIRPFNPSGKDFNGFAAIAFETGYFREFFSPDSIGPQGRVMLLRDDGAPLVYEPRSDWAYTKTFADTALFREKLARSLAGTYADSSTALDGEPRILSYQRLSRFPVVAVVSLHRDDVLAPWVRRAALQISMTAFLCGVLLLISRLLFRHLDRLKIAQEELVAHQEVNRIKAAQVDAANDVILLLDLDGRVVQVNQAFSRMTGYERDEVVGRLLHDFEPPDFAERIKPNIERLLEKGVATFESAYLAKGGETIPIEVSASFIESEGRPYLLSTVRGIIERKRQEEREHLRARILEEMAKDVPLSQVLDGIVRFVEQECTGSLCSILLVDKDEARLRHGVAPSLPDDYNRAVDGIRIAEGIGSCGTAAFRGERVVVEDIEGHPFWKGFKPAREAGLRACWSQPIIAAEGEALGTFAVYFREPRSPANEDLALMGTVAHLASIAIGRHKGEGHRRQLEEQLHHIQRIESIGQLTGGIAHDFNNLLTPILGYAELLKMGFSEEDKRFRMVSGVITAACKARDLTQKLLSFGRKQMLCLEVLDLNEIIGSFQEILRRTIRENIRITLRLDPESAYVLVDRGQMEQIILNLAVNAQDAINGAGSLTIESGRVLLDDEYVRQNPGLNPGHYVLLAVTDTGGGMDDATLAHIFEPFFTTKPVGQGTGLGLATVYGIVKQHEGHISARSEVGKGTTFNIYLPLSNPPAFGNEPGDVPEQEGAQERTGGATILVVEDNDMVRAMAVDLLLSAGYQVLESGIPASACEMVESFAGTIDLLVSDVVMPGMNGQELYEHLVESRPGLRVLYISGYTNDVIAHRGMLEERINFLQKPFTRQGLLDHVRQVLEG